MTVRRSSRAVLWGCLIATGTIAWAGCELEAPRENVGNNGGDTPTASTGLTGATGDPTAGSGNGTGGGDSGSAGLNHSGGATGSSATGDVDAGEEELWPTPTFSKRRLLEATATCVVIHYDDFLKQAKALKTAAGDFADKRDEVRRKAVRESFLSAFASWQRAEAFTVGPASSDMMTGGQGLRDQIYSFPLTNRCSIDTNLVERSYVDGVSRLSVSQRGLAALEYLLFYEGAANACASASPINQQGTWAALSASEIETRRSRYAAEVANDVVKRAQALYDAWSPTGANFSATLADTGSDNPAFKSQQVAFDAINEALYYIETAVKDQKLGAPLAVSMPCSPSCSALVESPYAVVSTDHLRQNLVGVRRLFQGCGPRYSGLGFDDWLIKVGRPELASSMIDALAAAQSAVDRVAPPLEAAIASGETGEVAALRLEVKTFTDQLKSDFITTLDLEPPAGTVGDND